MNLLCIMQIYKDTERLSPYTRREAEKDFNKLYPETPFDFMNAGHVAELLDIAKNNYKMYSQQRKKKNVATYYHLLRVSRFFAFYLPTYLSFVLLSQTKICLNLVQVRHNTTIHLLSQMQPLVSFVP